MTAADRLLASALAPLPRQSTAPLWQGVSKAAPEDFVVEEVPAYEPSGSGDHLFLWLEKRGLPAMALISRLSSALGVAAKDVGMAGMKDARAISRQYVSVPAKAQAALEAGALAGAADLKVLRASRHGNKLKTGHLRGNRFVLRVTKAAPPPSVAGAGQAASHPPLSALVADLERLGLLNAFGQQRFGRNGQTLRDGLAVLGVQGAGAAPRLSGKALRLVLSAVQAALFNSFLQQRAAAGTLHRLLPGDVALVCRSQGPFFVDDAAEANQRRERKEIVLSGPIFGGKMLAAQGAAAEAEAALLARFGLEPGHFNRFAKLTQGTRRAAIVWPGEIAAAWAGEDVIELRFTLPSGSYATEVLAALFAVPTDEPAIYSVRSGPGAPGPEPAASPISSA